MSGLRDYDVIIVGAGGAGLAAAIEAGAGGSRVLLLEAGRRVGGSTALSSGVIYAAGTAVQQAAGVADTPDAMFAYCMALSQNRLDAALLRRFCDESAKVIGWLEGLGAIFDPQRLYAGGAEPPGVKRSHRCPGSGPGLVEILERAALSASVEIVCNTRVRELMLDRDGGVAGISVDGQSIRTGAVVLACGGFGNNMDLVRKLYPEVVEAGGDWLWYLGATHSLGDGLVMGEQAGTSIGNHNRGLVGLTHGFARDNELFHPDWLVFVNREGRRFVREFSPYGLVARAVMDQPGKTCYAIFDEATRRMATPRKEYLGLMDQSWTAEKLAELAAKGRILSTHSLQELAAKAGIDADVLVTTVDNYNRDCEAGCDTRYGKNPQYLRAVREAPFYAAEIRAATLAGTFAGIRIDRNAQALDRADRPIPGLFAAGETTASMGEIYVGGGNAIANALVFGRIAGRSAATWSTRIPAS